MPQIAIIGPGALGCLFASACVRAGADTWLLDYNPERAALLNAQGIIVEQGGGRSTEFPTVSTECPSSPDLAIVLTKAYATPEVALPPDIPVLTLQNGLGNAEILAARCSAGRVLAGTTSEAVTWLAPGQVRHVAPGRTVLGPWTDCPAGAAVALLREAGFDVSETENPRRALWEKVVINAAINPLTALLNIKNGALLDLPETRALMAALAEEAMAAAQAEGFRLDSGTAATVEQVCAVTGENISSMLQDIRNGKRTEIDAISGEIMRRANAAGLSAPRNETVYRLVRALEAS